MDEQKAWNALSDQEQTVLVNGTKKFNAILSGQRYDKNLPVEKSGGNSCYRTPSQDSRQPVCPYRIPHSGSRKAAFPSGMPVDYRAY
ncbi:MAG: hypothetical protein Q4F41_18600 [Eubacteriales bacterium]|nr:hypothetical protein [Eubacteriales bacterium]